MNAADTHRSTGTTSRQHLRLINREELTAKLAANHDLRLVMAVGPWEFRAKHIPGSLGFPSPQYALLALGRDDEIVLYANNHHRVNTAAAYHALAAHGYRSLWCYAGGLADWEDAGYPVEGDAVDGDAVPAAGERRWPHGHSPHGRELNGAGPHCDNGWSGPGWSPARVPVPVPVGWPTAPAA
jgi:rhodanese-related sulfurtransferase